MKPDSKPLWPADYGLDFDHCADVLAGCYDVPLMFHVEHPPVILDIGANVGAFTRWAVSRWPGCTIHCYEPAPKNFTLLERTIASIGPEQSEIHAHNVAVFHEARKMVLHLAKTNCGAHSFYNLGESGDSTIEVDAVNATSLPKADILKIDIEGAEMPVLLALHDVGRLAEFSAVMLEYHSNVIALATKQLLMGLGFTLTGEKVHEKHRGELRFVKTDLLPDNYIKPGMHFPVLRHLEPVAKKPGVFIATPAHDHKFHSGYCYSLLSLVNSQRFKLTFARAGGCGVARARNNMAHDFLTTIYPDGGRPERYAAIDADIGFNPDHLARAIAFDKPIVCVPYALKQEDLQWCMNSLPGEKPDPATGFVKVSTAGTGFMVIKREVFEKMIAEFPDIAYDEDLPEAKGQTRWDFFSMGVVSRHYLTEDWFFCVRARELGFDIWMDAMNHVKHEGLISYPIGRQRAQMFEEDAK